MAKKDDVYIALIKFVKEKTTITGLMSIEEGMEFLKTNYPDLSEETFSYYFHEVTSMLQHAGAKDLPKKYRLSSEAYFQLLEHEELEEARASSQKALRVAIGAMVISIVMAFIQIIVPAKVVLDDPIVVQLPHAHSY